MAELTHWQASIRERYVAWIVSGLCIILIAIASAYPQWFDFSLPTSDKPLAEQSHQPVIHTSTQRNNQAKALPNTAKAIASKQYPVRVKPVQHKPVTPATVSNQSSLAASSISQNHVSPGYYIQMGAFSEKKRANTLLAQLMKHGWQVVIVNKNNLHAVWIGPEPTRTRIEKLHRQVAETVTGKGFIVRRN